jgi:hypothetical protein
MKTLVILMSLATTMAYAKKKPLIIHDTCKIAVSTSYAEDGLNKFLTQMARNYLPKKNFELVAQEDAIGVSEKVMGLEIDLSTSTKGDGSQKGRCEAVLAVKGDINNDQPEMTVATVFKHKGKITKVASECVNSIKKELKRFPECATSIGSVEEPVDPADEIPQEETTDEF